MSDLDIRSRLADATQPAFARPFDATEDLERGRRAQRRRRATEVAAGASACAVAGVAVVAGLSLVTGGEATGPARHDGGEVASTSVDPSAPSDPHAVADRLRGAFVEHLRPAVTGGLVAIPIPNAVDPVAVAPKPLYHGTDQSALFLTIRDDVRAGNAPVPLLCAGKSAYDNCQRQTRDDGTEVVVGRGASDLLAATWGRGGDLVEVHVHWSSANELRDVTIDQLVGLATDDRVWVPNFESDSAGGRAFMSPST